jgi:heme-degrading monooxygenase HmoA
MNHTMSPISQALARTPEPPYYAAIFSSVRTDGDRGYAQMAERLMGIAAEQPGFLGADSARGADGVGITVSYWSSEEAIAAWRAHADHRPAQDTGKRLWYGDYQVRVAKVERAYGKSHGASEAMAQTKFKLTVEIHAPAPLVWPVMTDVGRWPEWTSSVSRVKLLTPGPLRIGSRVRVHQPRLPPAAWRVTELSAGEQFTWVSVAPGVSVVARHAVEAAAKGSRVTLSVGFEGWFGRRLARWMRGLTERYLALEANGLKDYCERRTTLRRAFVTDRKC